MLDARERPCNKCARNLQDRSRIFPLENGKSCFFEHWAKLLEGNFPLLLKSKRQDTSQYILRLFKKYERLSVFPYKKS